MRHGRFAFWNLLAWLGFAVSVTASAYGVTRVVTGHRSGHDLLILAVGIGAGVLITTVFVRRKRRRARDRNTP
jgi:membrane protein DedA with SNARE-associated domain